MLKTLAPAFVAVLIAGMFVACAGGGADPTPTQETALAQPATSTATTSEPTATATVPAATATATEPASPTPAPTRTPGAAPTRLIPTATPTPTPTPTATPEQGDEVAQLLGFAALTADDLGGDWALDSTEVPDLVGDESTAICGQPR
ncbi:MAG TPA: hypothetical protein VMM78_15510, partial [Thermomicrobiales bacterium]|nr:hypothetical protein [Thermomicrobiales bacterium]